MIESLFEGADVQLECDFFDTVNSINCMNWRGIAKKLVYTGPIDQFYDYKFGHLQYRTVVFETCIENTVNYQGNAVVNYTEREIPYTRVIEHKHFEMFGAEIETCSKTVISKEYSIEWKPGMEPYYPVNDAQNNRLADKYREMAKAETDIIFGGRLADYKYYDMALVIELAMRCEV